MKWYLAGRMSGIPQFNYPRFDAVATRLRDSGLDIQSPAEMDAPEIRAEALASADGILKSGSMNGETWGDFLARDVKLISDKVDGIILMDDWQRSKGAKLEAFVGLLTGKQFAQYNNKSGVDKLDNIYATVVLWAIYKNLVTTVKKSYVQAA